MALETTDIFPVQKTGGGTGSVRKATIGALLSLAQTTAGYWQRVGSTLNPVNDGDDIEGIGDISAENISLTGTIEADNITITGTLSGGTIDGGEYAT